MSSETLLAQAAAKIIGEWYDNCETCQRAYFPTYAEYFWQGVKAFEKIGYCMKEGRYFRLCMNSNVREVEAYLTEKLGFHPDELS